MTLNVLESISVLDNIIKTRPLNKTSVIEQIIMF